MKIAIVSDLHWESEQVVPLNSTDFDVLVVAGDALGGHDRRDPIDVLSQWVADKPIIFVPGNHEFECRDIRSAVARLKSSAVCQSSNIHVLYNDTLVIDGVRFLGSTLWTDFCLNGKQYAYELSKTVEQNMPDFKYKRPDGLRLKAKEVEQEHSMAMKFLQYHLNVAHEGPTVVVSHFAPHEKSVHPKYASSPLNAWFANNLPEQLIAKAQLWIHGHTHTSFDYQIEHEGQNCRVVCNPSGFHQTFTLKGQNEFVQHQLLSLFPVLALQDCVTQAENPQFQSPLIVQI